MNSCLYELRVTHLRLRPRRHRLAHRMFMFYLDIDEIDLLAGKDRFIGHNRFAFYSFHDRDHALPDGRSVRRKIEEFVKSRGLQKPVGRIMLLTHLRVLGYVFNPISIYYCFDSGGRPLCAAAEVGNTFGERKFFYLGPEAWNGRAFVSRQEKYYYISPFVRLDVTMEFRLPVPGDRLRADVDDYDYQGKFFYAGMTGRRVALNGPALLRLTLRYPVVTVGVIAMIHWHAFRLFLKRIPFHAKEDNVHLQKEVLRGWRKNGIPTTAQD